MTEAAADPPTATTTTTHPPNHSCVGLFVCTYIAGAQDDCQAAEDQPLLHRVNWSGGGAG